MNLSLILIFVMILVVIPALVRQLFPKETEEVVRLVLEINAEERHHHTHSPENPQENVIENTRGETISDIIAASAGLLALPSNIEEKQDINKIIQKELIFEKIITIKALEGQNFMGYALLQSLHNAGLKFSSKGLFYYMNDEVQGKILFELSPSIAPYRFNLAEIGAFKTPGLVLKIIESADERIAQKIAEILADELGGEVEC